MTTTTGHISPQTRISAALKTTSTTLLTPGDSIHYRQPINMALIVTKDKSKESTNILKPKHKLQNSRFETMEANHETAISHHEIMINLQRCYLFFICTQGRGDAHLNPGLCNRNSVRVAKGAYHPRWASH